MRFGRIVAGVEECPGVGREVVAAGDLVAFCGGELVDVIGDGLPAVVVHRAAAPAFVVLRRVHFRRRRVRENRTEADAVEAHLLDTVELFGQRKTAEVEHGREHVGRVAVLIADARQRRRCPGRRG